MIEAVAFDIDNTLTDNVSWLELTRQLGASVPAHEEIFARFLRKELPYDEAKAQLLELWQATGNANRPFMQALFENWPLREGVEDLVRYAHDQGYQTALITGSIDLFAETIAKRLGVPHWYPNTTLVWDGDNLVDLHYERDQGAFKLKQLREFAKATNTSLSNCVIVADGDNDIETFRETGRGIAVGSAHPSLLKVAWQEADTLGEVIKILTNIKA